MEIRGKNKHSYLGIDRSPLKMGICSFQNLKVKTVYRMLIMNLSRLFLFFQFGNPLNISDTYHIKNYI